MPGGVVFRFSFGILFFCVSTAHIRLAYLLLLPALFLSGCAANLKAVRNFADETKKIGVAFDPILNRTVEQCQQQFQQRRIYTTDAPLSSFDAEGTVRQAADVCKDIANANLVAAAMSKALSDYASQLSAVAADGVASSVDDDYDELAGKLGEFRDLPQEKVGAITSLLKFITSAIIAKTQRDAIVEALSHEEAVGILADALVTYTDRVYTAYLTERLRDQPLFVERLRDEKTTPISSRLRVMDIYQQTSVLREQQKTVAHLRNAVDQMKVSMRDLKSNIDKLSAQDRMAEVQKLAKEVRTLYKQLAKAF